MIWALEPQVVRKGGALSGPFGRQQLHIDRVDVLRRKRILFDRLRCQTLIHLVLVKEPRYAGVFDYWGLQDVLGPAVESVDDLILQGSCRQKKEQDFTQHDIIYPPRKHSKTRRVAIFWGLRLFVTGV